VSLHRLNVDGIVDVSEVHAMSDFRFRVSKECTCMYNVTFRPKQATVQQPLLGNSSVDTIPRNERTRDNGIDFSVPSVLELYNENY
jgi:hypothetical protein